MRDIPQLVPAILAGVALGLFYFGGLWWTVRKALSSEQPALWFFGSLLVRTGLILAGFYVISQGQVARLVACLVGFIVARVFVVKRIMPSTGANVPPVDTETRNAHQP